MVVRETYEKRGLNLMVGKIIYAFNFTRISSLPAISRYNRLSQNPLDKSKSKCMLPVEGLGKMPAVNRF